MSPECPNRQPREAHHARSSCAFTSKKYRGRGSLRRRAKTAQVILEYLQSQGYRIIPVNPKGGEILGERVYTSLEEIEVAVDVVEVFRPAAAAETIAREAVGIGADVVWFQLGTHTTEAIQPVADGGLL